MYIAHDCEKIGFRSNKNIYHPIIIYKLCIGIEFNRKKMSYLRLYLRIYVGTAGTGGIHMSIAPLMFTYSMLYCYIYKHIYLCVYVCV